MKITAIAFSSLILILLQPTIAFAQNPHLEIEGNVTIQGNINVNHADDTTSLFIGRNAGVATTFSSKRSNTFVGTNAGMSNTTGGDNSFFGRDAGKDNEDGAENSFFGWESGKANTTGYSNSFFGSESGSANQTGYNNIYFGDRAGQSRLSMTQSSFLGAFSGSTVDGLDQAIAIGYNALVGCSNCAVIGGVNSNAVMLGLGVQSPLQKIHIHEGTAAMQNLIKFTNNTTGSLDTDGLNIGLEGDGSGRLLLLEDKDLVLGTNNSEKVTIKNSGEVGIGIATPLHNLHIHEEEIGTDNFLRMTNAGTGSTPSDGFDIGVEDGGDAIVWMKESENLKFATGNSVRMTVKDDGNVGIGVAIPDAQLHTSGSVRFATLGAGTVVSDVDGNLSVFSDIRLKRLITPFVRGLSAILQIDPIQYQWNQKSNMETNGTYTGFSAQNVSLAIPEAVYENEDGYLTLSDRPVIAALVNAVKEQQSEINDLRKELTELRKMFADVLERSN